jgi:ATP-dependent exoDNAse (exonuclease V) beta subunit
VKGPSDQSARARAARDVTTSITVNAGAGSGKTSVLAERIVSVLVAGRVAPGELAAITFTEKAAGELLVRVRDTLEAELAAAADGRDAGRSATLADLLARFGELTLSTIHGFCHALLRHESLESAFAPDTALGDDSAARELFDDGVRAWLADLRGRRPELWRVLDAGVTPAGLTTAVGSLFRYRTHGDVVSPEPFDVDEARRELRAIRDRARSAARACSANEDVLLRNNADLLWVLDQALGRPASETTEAVLDVLSSVAKPSRAGGTLKNWGSADAKEHFKEVLAGIPDWRARVFARIHREVVRDLRAELFPHLEEDRRLASLATFDDLLTDAARLLRESPAARARLSARYRCVLIDEVQDTDPTQAEVAALLTRALEDEGPWHAHPPEPGRLFAVGDPRQSIYRFRGADVGTFGRLENLIPTADRLVLSENFRSVPGIVAWVNHVFAGLPGYAPQRAHRGPAKLEPVVLLQATEEVDEVDGVIRHLGQLLAEGASIVDRKTGRERPLEPRDVMLVLPSWSRADETADRLRAAGLECTVEGGDTFFERDEVRLGLAAVRALAEPADGEAVVFVLRGLFGASHEELARHVAAGGSFRYTLPAPPPGPVANALAVLLGLHRERATTSLSGLLGALLGHTRAPAVWSLLPDGGSRLANLDKLHALVRAAEATTASPLAAAEELQRQAREAADKDLGRIDEEGHALRITSLFKAKGLEAPVVVFLHARRKADAVGCIIDHEAATVAVALGDLRPPTWEALAGEEKIRNSEERRRWAYVAATRARDQLVVCRPAPARAGGGEDAPSVPRPVAGDLLEPDVASRGLPPPGDLAHGARFTPARGVSVQVLVADELPEVAASTETFPGRDGEIDDLLSKAPAGGDPLGDARAQATRAALRAATHGCVRWRTSSSEPGAATGRWTPGESAEHASGGVGARGGDVVHAVMERLDLSRPAAELEGVAAELVELLGARAGLPADTVSACRTIVTRILRNPLLDPARRAPERWHEVPFTYSPRRGTVVSGTIDLCFPIDRERKKWVVFDWKSRVPARTDRLHAVYKEQLRQYARGLLASLGDVEVLDTQIVGPHEELGIVASVDDVLVEVRGDLRARLGGLLERGAPMPRVGYDVGDPAIAVELAWEERRLAIAPDASEEEKKGLESQGWTVRRALDAETESLLGLGVTPAEDA